MSDMDKLYEAVTSRNETGQARRQDNLLAFLADEHKRYMAEIQTLAPSPAEWRHYHSKEQEFDDARKEFLESLWDVIEQHFDDQNGDDKNGKEENSAATTC